MASAKRRPLDEEEEEEEVEYEEVEVEEEIEVEEEEEIEEVVEEEEEDPEEEEEDPEELEEEEPEEEEEEEEEEREEGDEDGDVEYEEVEVEEEVEEEIEEEEEAEEEEVVEEEEVEEEVEEDCDEEMAEGAEEDEEEREEMDDRGSNSPVAGVNVGDFSQGVESKGNTVLSQTAISVAASSEVILPCVTHVVEESSKEKGKSFVDDRSSRSPKLPDHLVGSHNDVSGSVKIEHGNVENLISVDDMDKLNSTPDGLDVVVENDNATDVEETMFPGLSCEDAAPAVLLKSHSDKEEVVDLQSEDDGKQKTLRSCASKLRPRNWSAEVDHDNGNKRPAIVCEYFAKGWCVKGSSCRFIHKRDHVGMAVQHVEGDTFSTKSELQSDKGSDDGAEGSVSPFHTRSRTLVGNADDFLHSSTGKHVLQMEEDSKYEEDDIPLAKRVVSSSALSVDSQKLLPYEAVSRSVNSCKGREGDVGKENNSSDHVNNQESSVAGGGSVLRGGSFPENTLLSGAVGVVSGFQSESRVSPFSSMHESAVRRNYSLDARVSSGYRSSVNIDSSSSVPFSSMGPSFNISGCNHTSSTYSSMNVDALGARSQFKSDKEDGVFRSLLHDSSFRGSDSEYSDSKDSMVSFKYTSRFTPYKWEPSVPFRPSFSIPSLSTPSSDVQYDPFRDSIEEPEVAHVSLHRSYNDQGVTFQDLFGQNSLDKRLRTDSWDKNYCILDKEIRVAEAESAAASASDVETKNIIADEENPIVPGSVKEILKANRSSNDFSSKPRGDGSRQEELNIEKGRHANELHEEESKAIKCFRAALIEFVKELMRPTWHEGRLSKDVYKVIVQKAEDKILSTIQPSQVPNTSDSIKQYLSSSRAKILKLIQAYVDKYGKF